MITPLSLKPNSNERDTASDWIYLYYFSYRLEFTIVSTMTKRTTLAERINKLVERHGSLRNVAKITETEPAYLSRLRSGKKMWPSETVLKRLGLKRVSVMIEYEETKQ